MGLEDCPQSLFSHLDEVDPSQDLEKATSQEKVEEVHKVEVSSQREISDTLDLARSFKTIRRDASISGQENCSVLHRDLKRRLDRIVKNPVLVYEVYEFKNTT